MTSDCFFCSSYNHQARVLQIKLFLLNFIEKPKKSRFQNCRSELRKSFLETSLAWPNITPQSVLSSPNTSTHPPLTCLGGLNVVGKFDEVIFTDFFMFNDFWWSDFWQSKLAIPGPLKLISFKSRVQFSGKDQLWIS